MAPVSLLTCGVLVGGEHSGAVAVFPRDGGTKAGMVWHKPQPRPRQTLMQLGEKKEDKDGAAVRFVGIGVTTAVNPTTAISRNVAHLREVSSNQEVEKMGKLEARREDERAISSRRSRRQWRWRFSRRSRERKRGREWTSAGVCGVSWHP